MLTKNILHLNFVGLLLILFVGCKKDNRTFEKITFENPYLFSSEIKNDIENDTTPWKYQMSSQSFASKGDYQNALKHWDLAMGTSEKRYTEMQLDSIKKLYISESSNVLDAVNYITESAKSNQVVIINEAHHNSSHRVFTKSLLKELFDIGYTNIGFETLGNGEYMDSLLMKRGYPTQETGYYTKDPQFGDLVRRALEIGFYIFPYEQTTDSDGKPREIEQAKNIQKEIQKRPNEKFLIHCGFDHVYEGVHDRWEKAMAARLKEYTGIDPLTIDQVKYSEKSLPELNHPIINILDIDEPSVIIDKNRKPLRNERSKRWTDLAVFHPRTKIVKGRPNWLFKNGNKPISLDIRDVDLSFPVMVLAYKKGEDINNAIPIDIVEIENRTDLTNLALKSGIYEVVLEDKKNNARKFEISVE
ncbi:hypothetical protein [Maribacter aurantiacus]|uniref:Uncharacterized protein n=1 Tax=Maribacter aurantiacus TaxID=1882343 RepID=A0A5R8M4U5_9FLAO|nr:hypothetical protein [Maribacter aurantiacus]TLF44586.1 hypothetical protein FEK29_10095 [Maribacter aurantiacus]